MAGQRHFSIRRGAAGLLAALLVTTGFAVLAPPASAQNPVTIDVTSGPNPVANGEQLTYTIVVTNTGGAKVTEVVLTDQVTGLTGIDGTNALVTTSTVGSCGQTGNTITCNAGTLQGFQSWTVTIRGIVTVPNGTSLNNTASVTGTKSATTFTTSDTVTTLVGSGGGGGSLPDLVATIKGPVTTSPSNDIVYTVTVDNVGTVKASDVVLTVTLPSSVSFVTETATNLFDCNLPAGSTTLTCSGGAINAGSNATVQVGVVAPSFDTTITLTTAVDPLNAIPEGNEGNNASQATTQVGNVPPPDTLALVKTDNPDPVTPYDPLTYTINLKNTSASRADYIEVVDGTQGLDASNVTVTSSVTGTSVPLSCTVAAPKVTCTTTRFQAGATAKITITGTVIQAPGSVILNTATVNGNIKNKGLTNTASTITVVRPSVDLTVTQHRTSPTPPAPVRAADRFDYTVTVGNSGLYDAHQVLVREPLPAGVFLDGFTASAAGTACAADAAQVVTCVIPTVKGSENSGNDQGSTETVVLQLIAPQTLPSSPVSSALGPITSTVTVDPNNAIPENEESNNTYTTTTDVVTGVDLTIAKKATPATVARNGELTYTITVTNQGTQDATGVVVRDPLPADVEFRAVRDKEAGPAGEQTLHKFTCGFSGGSKDPLRDRVLGGVVECRDGVIEGTYSGVAPDPQVEAVDFAVIEIDVFAPDEPGTYDNEVTVDPYGQIPEIDENDNFATQTTTVENTHTGNGMYKELFIRSIEETTPDAGGAPYATSGVLDYDIVVENVGAAAADQVTVRIDLPSRSRFRSAADAAGAGTEGSFTCNHAKQDDESTVYGGTITCTGGRLLAKATRAIRVTTFAPPEPVTALLQARVDPANAILEADEGNNAAEETTVVQAGLPTASGGTVQGTYTELRVKDILDNHDPVATSGTLDYTVTVENLGSADAFGVSFTATLPTGSTFRSADDSSPAPQEAAFHCAASGSVVTCSGARILAGGARDVVVSVFAPEQPTSTPPAHFVVRVDPDNAIPEGHEGNNQAEEFTQVKIGESAGGYTDLKITTPIETKIETADSDGAGGVQPGRLLTYTLHVSNGGTDDAIDVAVRDWLPEGVQFVSAKDLDSSGATATGFFTCGKNAGLNVVDCTGGYLKGSTSGGGERKIEIKVLAPLVHNRTITNTAAADPFNVIPEASEINNRATVDNEVRAIIDLTTSMGTGGASPADTGTWTFKATNAAGEARRVLVVADFSPGTIEQDSLVTPTGWSCTWFENPVNHIECTGDLIGNGAEAQFSVDYYKTATDAITSYVTADPHNTIVEKEEGNNANQGNG